MSWEKALHNCCVNELESIFEHVHRAQKNSTTTSSVHSHKPLPGANSGQIQNRLSLLHSISHPMLAHGKKNALILSPWPLIRYRKKIRSHCFPESFLVLFGRNNGGGSVLWAPKYAWCLNPCLQMLVPSILSHEINNPYNQLLALVVHPHQQRVVHHINRLSKRTIEKWWFQLQVWGHDCL